jgi:hypothetical protein
VWILTPSVIDHKEVTDKFVDWVNLTGKRAAVNTMINVWAI